MNYASRKKTEKIMSRIQNKRIWIKGLTMECPHGTPTKDCPLNGLRSLPISEANNVINGLPDKQVTDYFTGTVGFD